MSLLFTTRASLDTAVQMWVNDTQAASITYGHISNWGVSSITNMNGLFRDLPTFNEDISSWATVSVTDMGYMFAVDYMFAVRPSRASSARPNRILPARCLHRKHPTPFRLSPGMPHHTAHEPLYL